MVLIPNRLVNHQDLCSPEDYESKFTPNTLGCDLSTPIHIQLCIMFVYNVFMLFIFILSNIFIYFVDIFGNFYSELYIYIFLVAKNCRNKNCVYFNKILN